MAEKKTSYRGTNWRDYSKSLRQLTGFVETLFALIEKVLPVPEFSRLSKRSSQCLSHFRLASLEKISHIIIDSTGFKVFGERGWLETKHGKQYQQKIWRTLHIVLKEKDLLWQER